MRRFHQLLCALLALSWTAPLNAQQPTGTVRGRITDNATQQGLSGVTVSIGSRNTLTLADGRYSLSGVPAGSGELRARIIGYAEATQPVTLAGGDTVTVDVALTGQALTLSEVVVTGYGEQRAGNITGAVSNLTPEEFNSGRIINPAELIAAKAPGVLVVDNNEPGGGLAIRIRGATSVSAQNDPLYVIDGMPVGTGAGKKALWTGRILSALAVLFLGFDAVFKLTSADAAASASAQLGWSASAILVLGIIELVCGLAIAAGALLRPAAFLASGTMAVAYLQFHWKGQLGAQLLPGVNKGELALVYAPGRIGVDETRRAAQLVVMTTDVDELRRLGPFDEHGDPIEPPVRFEPYVG